MKKMELKIKKLKEKKGKRYLKKSKINVVENKVSDYDKHELVYSSESEDDEFPTSPKELIKRKEKFQLELDKTKVPLPSSLQFGQKCKETGTTWSAKTSMHIVTIPAPTVEPKIEECTVTSCSSLPSSSQSSSTTTTQSAIQDKSNKECVDNDISKTNLSPITLKLSSEANVNTPTVSNSTSNIKTGGDSVIEKQNISTDPLSTSAIIQNISNNTVSLNGPSVVTDGAVQNNNIDVNSKIATTTTSKVISTCSSVKENTNDTVVTSDNVSTIVTTFTQSNPINSIKNNQEPVLTEKVSEASTLNIIAASSSQLVHTHSTSTTNTTLSANVTSSSITVSSVQPQLSTKIIKVEPASTTSSILTSLQAVKSETNPPVSKVAAISLPSSVFPTIKKVERFIKTTLPGTTASVQSVVNGTPGKVLPKPILPLPGSMLSQPVTTSLPSSITGRSGDVASKPVLLNGSNNAMLMQALAAAGVKSVDGKILAFRTSAGNYVIKTTSKGMSGSTIHLSTVSSNMNSTPVKLSGLSQLLPQKQPLHSSGTAPSSSAVGKLVNGFKSPTNTIANSSVKVTPIINKKKEVKPSTPTNHQSDVSNFSTFYAKAQSKIKKGSVNNYDSPAALLKGEKKKMNRRRQGLKSIFMLPKHELRYLARKAGMREVKGFLYNPKTSTSWPESIPRPTISIAWRHRLVEAKHLSCIAHLFRLLHASLKWDIINDKPPKGVKRVVTSNKGEY